MAAPRDEQPIFVGIGLDFETGDTDCQNGACTQLAIHATRLDSWEIIDSYVAYFSPYNKKDLGGKRKKVLKTKGEQLSIEIPMVYKQEALDYSGITMDMLRKQGLPLEDIAHETLELVKRCTLSKMKVAKPFLIGQNITFDVGFLQQLMEYAGTTKEFAKVFAGHTDFYGNFQPHYVDTIDLGRLALAHDPSVVSYNLEIMSEKLGIELDDAHDASADVMATLNVAIALSQRMRNGAGGAVISHQSEKTRQHFKI